MADHNAAGFESYIESQYQSPGDRSSFGPKLPALYRPRDPWPWHKFVHFECNLACHSVNRQIASHLIFRTILNDFLRVESDQRIGRCIEKVGVLND